DSGCEELSHNEDKTYRKVVLKNNKVVGLIFVGSIEKSGVIYGLLKDGVDVGPFKSDLLAEDFGLAHFPHELRQQRLRAAEENPLTKARLRKPALVD
ncbi:MAG: hypothetical protein HY664_06390, partial [Chloroflexi bacterium]|nr:hypothetical protein [Chloroflexota bacterium]